MLLRLHVTLNAHVLAHYRYTWIRSRIVPLLVDVTRLCPGSNGASRGREGNVPEAKAHGFSREQTSTGEAGKMAVNLSMPSCSRHGFRLCLRSRAHNVH